MSDRVRTRPRVAAIAMAATVAIVAGCAIGGGPGPSPLPARELVVGVARGEALSFEPASISAPAARLVRITFRNDSSLAHNLTFQAPISASTRTIVQAGASDTATFTTPEAGTYAFVCTIHMGMTGTLIVE